MTKARRRAVFWFDYGVAVGSVLLAGLVTLWLWPLMRPMPFAWLFAAVMVSRWRGDMGPGVCATVVALAFSLWLLFPSGAAVFAASPEELNRLAVFLGIALIMSVLTGARHEAEATLRESEENYRLLFDSMNEGFCVVEVLEETQDQPLDYRFLLVNPAFARLTGIPEAVGKRMRAIAPLHEEYWFTTYEQVAVTGESCRFEHQAAQLQHWYDVHAFRVGPPAARTVAILFTDITARKQAEESLRQSEQTLQQERDLLHVTLASIGDAVIATDAAARITFLNPVAEGLTGWPLQEVLGHPLPEVFRIIHEHTRQPAENPVNKVLGEGVTVGLANHTALLTRDGREVPIADSGSPIRGQDGQVYGSVLVFRDVTEQHRAEGVLRQAKEAAEAADRLKSEFLATMSHELRTPLGVIVGYTDMLLDGAAGELSPPQIDMLQRLDRNTRGLCELISMVLDLNRLEAGRLPVDVQAVSIPTFFAELRAETYGLWEQSGLIWGWVVAPDLPVMYTDAGKLKVILKNLLSNAVKFTPSGSVTLVAAEQEGGIEFCVTDTGIGIPVEAQAWIFEPFRQLDGSDTRRYSGSGLGLHIVQRLVDVLGGHVTVESTVGQGSTFRVWLPVYGAPAA